MQLHLVHGAVHALLRTVHCLLSHSLPDAAKLLSGAVVRNVFIVFQSLRCLRLVRRGLLQGSSTDRGSEAIGLRTAAALPTPTPTPTHTSTINFSLQQASVKAVVLCVRVQQQDSDVKIGCLNFVVGSLLNLPFPLLCVHLHKHPSAASLRTRSSVYFSVRSTLSLVISFKLTFYSLNLYCEHPDFAALLALRFCVR